MSTIIQIRGNSGSGKSTLVRTILDKARRNTQGVIAINLPPKALKHFEGLNGVEKLAKRKKPIGYMITNGLFPFVVLGHYESDCGGCDNISGYDIAYRLIEYFAKEYNVLYEGLLLSEEVNRAVALAKPDGGNHDYFVHHIDTDIETCVSSINERRRRKNPDADGVNETNTRRRHATIDRAMERLRKGGVDVTAGSREEIMELTRERLKLK